MSNGRAPEVGPGFSGLSSLDSEISETSSFVSESSGEMDSSSDMSAPGRCSFESGSGRAKSGECVVDGEYSSSGSEGIEGLNTSLPLMDTDDGATCEESRSDEDESGE